jgi:sugar/nucleoside kinase (ribokinase family)
MEVYTVCMTNRDYEKARESAIGKIRNRRVNVDVVTMPDLFLDHSVAYNHDSVSFARSIASVASKGGGELPNLPQRLELGGNAAICTLALSSLGARVHPIMKTSRLGLAVLDHFYQGLSIDLSHVKTDGKLTPTIILEMHQENKTANVMLGDSSSVSGFGFEDLQPEDLNLISNAEYTCVFNWIYNPNGTELARGVFNFCKQKSTSRTFFDPADPWPRRRELPELARALFRDQLLDILGVNENEAILFARALGRKIRVSDGKRRLAAGLEAAKAISAHANTKVYLHTSEYSASAEEGGMTVVPTFQVNMRRGTGAGDSWNAGILVAESLGLNEGEKLLFANAVAANYISRAERAHSTINGILDYLQNQKNKLKKLSILPKTKLVSWNSR